MKMVTLNEIKRHMSNKIIIPKEFDVFYKWSFEQTEKNGNKNFPICFEWENNFDFLEHFFESDYSDRFGVFGVSGCGSLYSFWIDDQGKQKIVYLSSDGGNFFVLGNTFLEFLQYLSIGYADPDIDDFDLTNEQIVERDKIDYSSIKSESMNEYYENYGKPLKTEEGIKELFGNDLDDETLAMFKEINQNADLSFLKTDNKTIENIKKGMQEKEEIYIQYLADFQQWLVECFQVKLPKKGTEILNLNDKSFENWMNKVTGWNNV